MRNYYTNSEIPEEMQTCEHCEYWGNEGIDIGDVACYECDCVSESAEVQGFCKVFTHSRASCPDFCPTPQCLAEAALCGLEDEEENRNFDARLGYNYA